MGFDHVKYGDAKRRAGLGRAAQRAAREAKERRAKFLVELESGKSIEEACAAVPISRKTYAGYRQKHRDFAAMVDAILVKRAEYGRSMDAHIKPGKIMPFVEFRKVYLGMDTPWFQQLAIAEYDGMNAGQTVLMLWPPEHGKTTLFEDYVTWKLTFWPDFRFLTISESQNLTRQMVGRLQLRFDPEGPFPNLVSAFGPYAPQTGSGSTTTQVWAADRFTVWKKQQTDDRSYSFEALGWTAAIAGRRADHLHVDDIQSLKSIDHTPKMFDTFRQDMISRPGPKGRVTINGTRVGEGDFYQTLMEAWDEDLLKVIKFPAIITDPETGEQKPLWEQDPDTGAGYTLEELDLMRRRVGEDAWSRNYMQEPAAGTSATFSDDVIARALNPMRSATTLPPVDSLIYIGLDPAIGSNNCFLVGEATPRQLKVHWIREDVGLARNEQIMAILEELVIRFKGGGSRRVSDVVIEAMAFQRGLSRDARLTEMAHRHGFNITEHLTGANKYDENIGIASMATSFLNGEVELPYADDDVTRGMTDALIRQLKAWRPGKRGTVLRQDQVMALWFVWIRWMNTVRGIEGNAQSTLRSGTGLPFTPTTSPGITNYKPKVA